MTFREPMRVLIVEDEALLAMEIQVLLEDAGHEVVGWATSSEEAMTLAGRTAPDLAFIDVHLADGPTGVSVAERIAAASGAMVVFVTANAKRLPTDYAGAAGVIAKPFTRIGLLSALRYLHQGVRTPPPKAALPAGFTLAPAYERRWAA